MITLRDDRFDDADIHDVACFAAVADEKLHGGKLAGLRSYYGL